MPGEASWKNNMGDEKKGLILLVHGSRDASWMEPFFRMRDQVAAGAPGVTVGLACLQFCGPDLEEALCEMAEEGVRMVLVVPVFISALGHVLKDVPPQVESARSLFPDLEIEISPALGDQPEVSAAFRESILRLAKEFF